MTTTAPYSWIRHLSPELLPKDDAPLLGFPPSFPWEAFVKHFSETFDLKDIHFLPSLPEPREAKDLFSDLGTPLVVKEFSVAPMKGPIWWAMSEQDMRFLMGFLLKKEAHPEFDADQDFLHAFIQFLSLEAIHAFQSIDFDKTLSIQMKDSSTAPTGACLCMDMRIQLPEDTVNGRLILSSQFSDEWKTRYATINTEALYQTPNAEYVEVIVHVEIGNAALKTSQWEDVVPGDFVVLDSCSLKPGEDNGRVLLTINGKPFFRGKLKDGNIKILEYPLYHEVGEPMAKKNPEDEIEEDEESEFEHTEEESDYEEEYTEEEDDEDLDEQTDDDSDEDEDSDEIGDEDEEFEEDEDSEEEEDEDADVDEETEAEAQSAPPTSAKDLLKPAAGTGKKDRPSIDDISLIVTAEVARIQMSVKKLVELQPGNLLELNVHPEDGIDLVVNGKRVARGELLSLGDALGVRVLEIG